MVYGILKDKISHKKQLYYLNSIEKTTIKRQHLFSDQQRLSLLVTQSYLEQHELYLCGLSNSVSRVLPSAALKSSILSKQWVGSFAGSVSCDLNASHNCLETFDGCCPTIVDSIILLSWVLAAVEPQQNKKQVYPKTFVQQVFDVEEAFINTKYGPETVAYFPLPELLS